MLGKPSLSGTECLKKFERNTDTETDTKVKTIQIVKVLIEWN